MTKLPWILAFSSLLSTAAVAQDSLRDRLAAFDRFGIQAHDGTLSITLHVYTHEQYDANLAELQHDKAKTADHNAAVAEYKKQRQEVQESFRRDRTPNVIEQMANLRGQSPPGLELSDFAARIRLHAKVSLGVDYIALAKEDDAGTEVLVPLSQIGRVVFRRSAPIVKDASDTQAGG